MQYWWWRTNASWPHPIKCNSTDILHHSTQASFSLRDIRYKGITNFPWCTCTVEATQCVLLFSNTLKYKLLSRNTHIHTCWKKMEKQPWTWLPYPEGKPFGCTCFTPWNNNNQEKGAFHTCHNILVIWIRFFPDFLGSHTNNFTFLGCYQRNIP